MKSEVEATLAHYGVKGMKWGVRRGDSGGSSVPRKSSPSKSKGPTPRRSKAEMELAQAKRDHRIKVGKEVTKAVLIAVGSVAVASVAGPVVAAGAAAIARSLPGPVFTTESTSRIITGDYGVPSQAAIPIQR